MEDGELLRVARGVDGKDDLRRTKFMGMVCSRRVQSCTALSVAAGKSACGMKFKF